MILLSGSKERLSSNRLINILFFILFIFYLFEGVFWVLFGNVWTDENWIFARSYLVTKGKLPYRDFFDHHQPLVSLVHALFQYLFGPSLFVGRATSFLFTFLTIILTCSIASKLAGKKAGILVLVLHMLNLHSFYYATTMSAHSIEIFLVVFAVYSLMSKLKKPLNYILSVAVMSLANCVKNLASPWIWVLLLFIIVKERRNPKIIFYSLFTAIAVMGLVSTPFIIIGKEKFFFGVIWLLMRGYKSTTLSRLDQILYLVPVIQNYFLMYLLLPAFLIYAWLKRDRSRKVLSYLAQHDIITLISLMVIAWFPLTFLWRENVPPIYWAYYYPLVTLLLAVGIIKLFESLIDNASKIFFKILITLLILLTPFLQPDLWKLLNIQWQRRELLSIYKVAKSIDKYTQKDTKVFTFTPAFAAQADRQTLPGMEFDMYSYYPSLEIERCKRLGLLNAQILIDYLNKKEAGILVLTQFRFFEPRGAAAVIEHDLPQIIKVIDANYYLKEKLTFADIFRGDVYIYLPR